MSDAPFFFHVRRCIRRRVFYIIVEGASGIVVPEPWRQLLGPPQIPHMGTQRKEPCNHWNDNGIRKYQQCERQPKIPHQYQYHDLTIIDLIISLLCILRYDMILIYFFLFLVLLVGCCCVLPQSFVSAMFGCDSALMNFHLWLFGLTAFLWSLYAWIFWPAVNLFFCHWLHDTGF